MSEDYEIILCRHWASNLNTPIFLVDPSGNLIFFNEAAEPLLGVRFAEVGTMDAEFWSSAFAITDENGDVIPPEELPLGIALGKQKPAYRRFNTVGLDGISRGIETTCFPLIGREGKFLGAVAIFWHRNSID